MGMTELLLFLVILITLGQHVVAWAAYWERKFELEETVLAKFKRKERKSKKLTPVEDELRASYIEGLARPQYRDLLIIRLFVFMVYVVRNFPSIVREGLERLREHRNQIVEEESSDDETCDPGSERERKPKRRLRVIPEASEALAVLSPNLTAGLASPSGDTNLDPRKTPWSEEDTVALIRAMKKYPTGTTERWQKIADLLNRSTEEVIVVMKQLKKSPTTNIVPRAQGVTGEDYQCCDSDDNMTHSEEGQLPKERQTTSKTSSHDTGQHVKVVPLQKLDDWSQDQQRSMEAALQKFPKGTEDRWDKIAEVVPGKSKEECMLRFKFLVEALKKKKMQEKLKAS